MGKVLKVREVGDPILEKECEEIEIRNINGKNCLKREIRSGRSVS